VGRRDATYDDNGNLTGDGSRTFTWNARNELTAIGGSGSASFAYDGLGRRRSRTVGAATTQFLYDELNPVQELMSGTPVANLLGGLGLDEHYARADSAGLTTLLTDVLGSSVALAERDGHRAHRIHVRPVRWDDDKRGCDAEHVRVHGAGSGRHGAVPLPGTVL
jgi:hypothetical protein